MHCSIRSVSPVPTVTKSLDDSKCDYTSLDNSGQDPSKDDITAEDDVKDAVKLQKLFRKLQRQVHSPEHQVQYTSSQNIFSDQSNKIIPRKFDFLGEFYHDKPGNVRKGWPPTKKLSINIDKLELTSTCSLVKSEAGFQTFEPLNLNGNDVKS